MQPLLVGFFFFFLLSLHHSSFCHPALNHLCSRKDLPWPPTPPPSLLPPIHSIPQCLSLSLSLSHPYSTSVFLTPPVTLCTPLIHQLALRADNGLFHIAKEKEGEKCSKRGSVRQRDRKLEKT